MNGACNSLATGAYAWNETPFRAALCANGTTPIPSTLTLDMGQSVSWGCNGLYGGTNTLQGACSANRGCPAISCGSAQNIETNIAPVMGLCGESAQLDTNAEISLGGDGMWRWNCVSAVDGGNCPSSAQCQAPSCLAGTPFELQPYVYFKEDGTPNNATMTVTCPGVCCSINDASEVDVTICNGAPGQIAIAPGTNTYPAACWIDDRDGDGNPDDGLNDDGETVVHRTGTVSTMCTARSCNSQGTCQATPTPANSAELCASSCNSDADCSKGRMIETRP